MGSATDWSVPEELAGVAFVRNYHARRGRHPVYAAGNDGRRISARSAMHFSLPFEHLKEAGVSVGDLTEHRHVPGR